MSITVTDLFCGAGGSSIGAEAVEGVTLAVAANHWQTAIDVHQSHFPEARHDVADISQADPRRYPRTNILLASPECTNHSQAKGISRKRQDPSTFDSADLAAERSRATMWDVVRFAEQIPYDAIVVENVVEATKWGPGGGGALWNAWVSSMRSFGYDMKLLSHNSMHHGVSQSRDRLYVVFTRQGLTPDLEMEKAAWCEHCAQVVTAHQAWKNGRTVGRYKTQWVWKCNTCSTIVEPDVSPAAEIIDWSIDCPVIGLRDKGLSQATRDRIWNGANRLGFVNQPQPFITTGAGNVHERTPGNRAKPITDPLAVQQTTLTSALVDPGFLFNTAHGGRAQLLSQPHPTVCAAYDIQSLVVPIRNNGNAYDPHDNPLGAVTAGGNHHGLLAIPEGILMRNQGTTDPWASTSTNEPARTLTTKGHQSLVMPYYGNGNCQKATTPLATVRTRDGAALVNLPDFTQAEKDQFVDNCGFRMLQPQEVAAAMAFPVGYIPRTLPKKDQVKLAGNAVTPPVMQWIVGRLAQAMGS
jgi:DNA (cytosine-5)-methyltransferase 1